MSSSPNDEPPPKQRNLRIASFATHATRGLLRDKTVRRKVMFWIVIAAVVMLFFGATFLAPVLDPQLRPAWFIVYWLACAWITLTAVLLAIFDLLVVRMQERDERRRLQEKVGQDAKSHEG